MPYATLNGIRLHYDTHGEGDPVLLINGLSAPSANWLFQVKGFSPHYRVITFDNRGVGETDMPGAAAYPTSQMAASSAICDVGYDAASGMSVSPTPRLSKVMTR